MRGAGPPMIECAERMRRYFPQYVGVICLALALLEYVVFRFEQFPGRVFKLVGPDADIARMLLQKQVEVYTGTNSLLTTLALALAGGVTAVRKRHAASR